MHGYAQEDTYSENVLNIRNMNQTAASRLRVSLLDHLEKARRAGDHAMEQRCLLLSVEMAAYFRDWSSASQQITEIQKVMISYTASSKTFNTGLERAFRCARYGYIKMHARDIRTAFMFFELSVLYRDELNYDLEDLETVKSLMGAELMDPLEFVSRFLSRAHEAFVLLSSSLRPLLTLIEYVSAKELMHELLIATLKTEKPGFDLENPEFKNMLSAQRGINLKSYETNDGTPVPSGLQQKLNTKFGSSGYFPNFYRLYMEIPRPDNDELWTSWELDKLKDLPLQLHVEYED